MGVLRKFGEQYEVGAHNHVRLRQMRIRLPTLALKLTGDITRSPKQGYQWPHKRTCVHQFIFLKKKTFKKKKTLAPLPLLQEVLDPTLVVEDGSRRGRKANLGSAPGGRGWKSQRKEG